MRIALVGPYHPDLGGVQLYTTHLAGELLSLGHEVVVISYHGARSRWEEAVRRSPRIGVPGLRGAAFIAHSAISIAREDPDVVLAQYAITSGLAAWLASMMGTPYTVTFHGSDLRVSPRLSRLAASRAVAVISVSSWLAGRLRERGIDVTGVIPGGVDPNAFSSLPPRERVRSELGLDPEEGVILSVGALVEAKGFDIIPEVASALEGKGVDATFILIGEGPLRRRIEAKAGRLGVSDRVRLLGRKEFGETVRYYRAADVLLHPAVFEGFGLVMLESMAAGTPVVATRVGGAMDLIEDGVDGFLTGRDPGEMASRLATLLLDRDLRDKMGRRGRDKALSRTWRRVAQDYVELLEGVIP